MPFGKKRASRDDTHKAREFNILKSVYCDLLDACHQLIKSGNIKGDDLQHLQDIHARAGAQLTDMKFQTVASNHLITANLLMLLHAFTIVFPKNKLFKLQQNIKHGMSAETVQFIRENKQSILQNAHDFVRYVEPNSYMTKFAIFDINDEFHFFKNGRGELDYGEYGFGFNASDTDVLPELESGFGFGKSSGYVNIDPPTDEELEKYDAYQAKRSSRASGVDEGFESAAASPKPSF